MPNTNSANEEAIAIVGLGCRFPGGANSPDAFWKMMLEGRDAITEIPEDRWSLSASYMEGYGKPGKSYARRGGFVDGVEQFDPGFFGISEQEAPHLDPQQRMLLEVTWEAMEDAGLAIPRKSRLPIGVYVGVSTHDYVDIQYSDQDRNALSPYTTTGSIASVVANRLSHAFDFTGPSVAVDTACSSSLTALHFACQGIRSGEASVAVVGGVNCVISSVNYLAFCSMSALAPDGYCKAFDARGDGFVRSEGAGMVVLKPLSQAVADGDRIYGTVLGTSINQDGATPGIAMPDPESQRKLVMQACQNAGIRPSDIGYVESHGTGTPVGDPVEAGALGSILGEGRPNGAPCLMGSVKTNIGHLEAGAGAAGLIKLALMLKHGRVPPNLHFETPNPKIDFEGLKLKVPVEELPLPVTPGADGRPVARVGINSFGIGGANAHAILEGWPKVAEADSEAAIESPSGGVGGKWPLLLSARSDESLAGLAKAFGETLSGGVSAASICRAAATRRTHHERRLVVWGEDADELRRSLGEFEEEAVSGNWTRGDMVGALGAPVFVFSGQGPQWWAMGRQLWEREPVFRQTLGSCQSYIEEFGDWSLIDELINASEDESRVAETRFAQPMIFAIQAGLTELWRSWGVEPAAVVGHSVGEAAAAYAAGMLSLKEGMRVMYHRGRCMDDVPLRGRMLAVGILPEEALEAIRPHGDKVSLGAINSPGSVVLSGDGAILEELAKRFEAEERFVKFLKVNYAFHSSQMEPAEPGLIKALADLEGRAPRIPLYSTVSGERSGDQLWDADYWWRNVRETVRFAPTIQRIREDGYGAFLEVGPHPVLSHSIKECLAKGDPEGTLVTHSLRRNRDESESLRENLARLHAGGATVDWTRFFAAVDERFVDLPTYHWNHKAYWNESFSMRRARLAKVRHPLLVRKVDAPDPIWEAKLDSRLYPDLNDHIMQGRVVFPGAGYVELGYAVAGEIFDQEGCALEDVVFKEVLSPPSGDANFILRTAYCQATRMLEIESCQRAEPSEWHVHASMKLRALDDDQIAPEVDLGAIRERCAEAVEPSVIYAEFETRGLHYGSAYRGIKTLTRRDGEALGTVRLPEAAVEKGKEGPAYKVHPAVIDSCFQVIIGTLGGESDDGEDGTYAPVGVDRVYFYQRPAGTVYSHVKLRSLVGEVLTADIKILDENGAVMVEFEGFQCRRISAAGKKDNVGNWIYRTHWQRVETEERPVPQFSAWGASADLAPVLKESLVSCPLDANGAERCAEFDRRYRSWLKGNGDMNAWREWLREFPDFLPELELLRRLKPGDSAKTLGLAALLDAGLAGTIANFDRYSVSWRRFNRRLEQVLGGLLDACPEGYPLSVLEWTGRWEGYAPEIIEHLQERYQLSRYTTVAAGALHADALKERFEAVDGWEVTDPYTVSGEYDLVVFGFADGKNPLRLKESVACLKPGGLLVLADTAALPEYHRRIQRALTEFGGDAAAQTDTPELPDRLEEVLREDGFVIARCTKEQEEVVRPALDDRASVPGFWLLFADKGDVVRELKLRMELRGQRCIVIERGTACTDLGEGVFSMRPGVVEDVVRLLDATFGAEEADCLGIVSGWGLDTAEADALSVQELRESQQRESLHIITLLRELSEREQLGRLDSLWLLSAGAESVGSDRHAVALGQAPQRGFARVLMSELPEVNCRTVDFPPSVTAAELESGVSLLLDDAVAGDEFALRGLSYYVPRLTHSHPPHNARRYAPDPTREGAPFKLAIPRAGSLYNLTYQEASRREPGAREVEVQVAAAALNFRDVMKALGIYPTDAGDAGILGDECCGTVLAAGSEIDDLKPGDHVIVLAGGCFASHIMADRAMLLRLPEAWSFETGAAQMVPYLTAYYALYHLARLEPGERVLIHAAAGGVGMAAVNLALARGAEVFATAGSPAKRDLVKALGAKAVFNSRSLSFAEEIRRVTHGEGVDVVLNSLAGEAINQSMSVLRTHGRFLEIGKRDIYGGSLLDLGHFRKSLSYFAIDLARLMEPSRMKPLLEGLETLFAAGDVSPLPVQVFPAEQTIEAFRFMAEARHCGKVVIGFEQGSEPTVDPNGQNNFMVREDGSYLVAGGLRGFGLAVAQWLADAGAKQLVLLSRSGASRPEAIEAIEAMRSSGVEVRAEAVDLSDAAAVDELFDRLDADGVVLNGIVHAAANYGDRMLLEEEAGNWHSVLAPKAYAAWQMHERTLKQPLDFFVLFSSISTVIGNTGQANYVAANYFLETLARYRRRLGLPGLALLWDRLTDVGYVSRNEKLADYMTRMGWSGLSAAQGMQAMERMIAEAAVDVAVARVDWKSWLKTAGVFAKSPRFAELTDSSGGEEGGDLRERIFAAADFEARNDVLCSFLQSQIAGLLKIPTEKVDREQSLVEMGLDSLMAVELMGRLESDLGVSLSAGQGAGKLTVASLAERLLSRVFGESATSTTATDNKSEGAPLREELLADLQLVDSVEWAPPGRADAASGDGILFTGGLSFLGLHCLSRLLEADTGTIYCLVGAPDESTGFRFLKNAADMNQIDWDASLAERRIRIVCGAPGRERFGLDEADYASLAAEVGSIHHHEALINHVLPYDELRQANVLGMLEIIRFASFKGLLRAVHYNSSLSVFGVDTERAGQDVPEMECPEHPGLLLGGYAESRWVAESMLRRAADRGLPTSIYRPGMMAGDTRMGRGTVDNMIWLVTRVAIDLGIGLESDFPLYLTPVDYVAETWTSLALNPASLGGTYHLIDTSGFTMGDLHHELSKLGYPLEMLSLERFQEELFARRQEDSAKPIAAYMNLFPEDAKRAFLDAFALPKFSDGRTREQIDSSIYERSSMTPERLRRCVDYFVETEFLPAPASTSKDQ